MSELNTFLLFPPSLMFGLPMGLYCPFRRGRRGGRRGRGIRIHHLFLPSNSADEGEEEDERILMVSQCFRSTNEEFWPMLITVLKQMHRATFAQPPDASSPLFVREVTPKSGLKWVHLSCGLPKLKWDRFPNSNCQSFFLWEDLGHGASGRAFLASSKSYRDSMDSMDSMDSPAARIPSSTT